MSFDKITFYNSTYCPYAQRVAITLAEVNAPHEKVEIDLLNKPDWYAQVNPEGKVPALAAEGQILAESLIVAEYVYDRFPSKALLPKEAIRRANIRFAIEFFGSKVVPETYKFVRASHDEGSFEAFQENVNNGFKKFNELLVQQSETGPYFLGEEYSLADIAIAPFLLRLYAIAKYYSRSDDFEFEQVKALPRLASFIKGNLERPSVKETYCGDSGVVQLFQTKFNFIKV